MSMLRIHPSKMLPGRSGSLKNVTKEVMLV